MGRNLWGLCALGILVCLLHGAVVECKTALIVVDMQRDFMDDGPVPVKGGYHLVPTINYLMDPASSAGKLFDVVVTTQDWHPKDHISFVTTWPHAHVLDTVSQCLGPDQAPVCYNVTLFRPHCIAKTRGARLVEGLRPPEGAWTVHKGLHSDSEAYSALYDLGRAHGTGLSNSLRARGVTTLVVTGVATDYCVLHTVLDALDDGFRVLLPVDAVAGVTAPGALRALVIMRSRGVVLCRALRESFSGLPTLAAALNGAQAGHGVGASAY